LQGLLDSQSIDARQQSRMALYENKLNEIIPVPTSYRVLLICHLSWQLIQSPNKVRDAKELIFLRQQNQTSAALKGEQAGGSHSVGSVIIQLISDTYVK
jgi:hypothetical protein